MEKIVKLLEIILRKIEKLLDKYDSGGGSDITIDDVIKFITNGKYNRIDDIPLFDKEFRQSNGRYIEEVGLLYVNIDDYIDGFDEGGEEIIEWLIKLENYGLIQTYTENKVLISKIDNYNFNLIMIIDSNNHIINMADWYISYDGKPSFDVFKNIYLSMFPTLG